MSLCFNEFMRSFVNKFSNLKITHCISSPALLNREAFLRTSRADSTSDLEGRSAQVLHHSNFRRHNHPLRQTLVSDLSEIALGCHHP